MSRISRAIGAIGLAGASLMANATTTLLSEDFSSGNPVTGTQYGLIPDGQNTAQGEYRVITNPATAFPPANLFTSFFDHTANDASGLMMYFDGAADPDPRLHSLPLETLWSATVPVAAGNTYTITYWLRAVTDSAPPQLQFDVDGHQLGTTITGAAEQWGEYSASFVAAVAGDALFSIRDLTTDLIGNDGAIDDIKVTFDATQVDPGNPNNPVPEPEEAALMAGGLGILGWMTRRRVRHPSTLQEFDAVAVA